MNRCTASPPCGNTGACNGAGACQLAATTVACGTQSCSGTTYTPVSHCNGTGGCLAPTASGCSPYMCGGDTCRTNCSMDSDCVAPFTCQGTAPNRSCALKANGLVCTAANQCISGSCVNGVCCGSAACGTCQTCNGTTPGACTPLAAGTPAPSGQCPAAPPCGNTGACNGASGCAQGLATTSCGLAASCGGTTYQPPSTCTGTGMCNQTGATTCGNYICGTATACRTDCTSDAHCSSTGLYCTGNATTPGSCVAKKTNGAACSAANQCAAGNCTDNVCCTTSSCIACQSCNVNGAGTCANVANGSADPPNCAPNGVCGNTGFCVSGACEQKPASTSCGLSAACSSTTAYQPPSFCSGTGTCSQTSTMDCGAYVCGNGACKSACSTGADCSGGNYCAGTACVPKKGPGAICTASDQCVSSLCTDGVCCNAGSCPTCQACNLNGVGTCSFVGTTTDPHGRCPNTGPCGNTGACDGNGFCAQQPNTLSCGPPVSCMGATYQPPSFCSGGGTCSQMGAVGCGAFVCNAAGSACLATCNDDDADCAAGFYCTGPNGTCAAKKAAGAGCGTGHECTLGNCTDNVCCAASSCPACQSCNVNGVGTCANVADGSADPPNCGPNGVCGNTGFCSGGVCAQVAANTTICASSSCPTASTFQDTRTCNGAGMCSTAVVQDCWPYACTTGGCPSTCGNDSQCVSGYCDGLHCVATKTMGDPCGRDGECGTAHCVDNVCCSTASCDPCMTCAASTQPAGVCNNIKNGDPDPRCPTEDPMTCGTNGTCDGSGVCKLYDALTQCSESCVSLLYTRMMCDGLHGCTLPLVDLCTLTCGPGGCSP